jgi:spastin
LFVLLVSVINGVHILGVGMSENKRTVAYPSSASVSSTASRYRKTLSQKTPVARGGVATPRNPKDAAASPKPVKESGNVYDDKLVEMINTTIVDRSPSVKWDDVAGLNGAKQALLEMVILPAKRRDLFTGLRRPARGNISSLVSSLSSPLPSLVK